MKNLADDGHGILPTPAPLYNIHNVFTIKDGDVVTLVEILANYRELIDELRKQVDEHQRDLYEVRGSLNIWLRAQK